MRIFQDHGWPIEAHLVVVLTRQRAVPRSNKGRNNKMNFIAASSPLPDPPKTMPPSTAARDASAAGRMKGDNRPDSH